MTRSQVQEWEQLGAQSCEAAPFSEAGFVRAALALPEAGDQHLLSVRDTDGLLLALPVVRTSGYRHVPLAGLMGRVHDYSFLGDPLVRTGSGPAAWYSLLASLSAHPPAPWLVLPDLSADGQAETDRTAAARHLGLTLLRLDSHDRATVRRRLGADPVQDRVSGVHRKGLRRLRRLLGQDLGGDAILHDRTGDPAALESFLRLEASGWKGRAGTALTCVPGGADFLRALQQTWPDRVQLLCLGTPDRWAAIQVNLRAGSTLFCFKTGFDEEFARRSPGLLLETDVLSCFQNDSSLELLDSCAVPGHPMAERLFPDTRRLHTVVVPLTRRGRVTAAALPTLLAYRRGAAPTSRPAPVHRPALERL